MRDRTVRAVSCADVAKDHERGRAVLPALTNVRAMRFLADRVQVEVAHELAEPEVVRPARRLHLEPAGLSLRQRFASVSAHDLVKRLAHVVNVRGGIYSTPERSNRYNIVRQLL